MKTIVFTRDWNDEGRLFRKGTLMNLNDEEANRLIRAGVAEERKPQEPTETKSDEPDSEGGEL